MNKQAYEHTVALALIKRDSMSKNAGFWDDIVNHLKANKKHYIRGGVGALAGAGIGAGIFGSTFPKSPGAWIGGVLGGAGVGAGLGVGGGKLYDIILEAIKNKHRQSPIEQYYTSDAQKQKKLEAENEAEKTFNNIVNFGTTPAQQILNNNPFKNYDTRDAFYRNMSNTVNSSDTPEFQDKTAG